MSSRLPLLALALALALVLGCADPPAPSPGSHLSGTVSYVVDGDSLKFKPADGREIEVRLQGIDAPEQGQAHAAESRRALKRLIESRRVELQILGHDRYGRELAVVLHDGANINYEMVRRGHAWAYTRYDPDPRLAELQRLAEDADRGLWRGSETPQPPWEWRRRKATR